MVLPRPMSSARQAPRPSLIHEPEPMRALALIGTQVRLQIGARVGFGGNFGCCISVQQLLSCPPAITLDQSARVASASASPAGARLKTGQKPQTLPSNGKPSGPPAASTFFQ